MTNEIMIMNELDAVSGGTNGEYKELRNLLPMVKGYDALEEEEFYTYRDPDEVAEWLRDNLGIEATIDIGAFYDPRSSAGSPNVYMRDGKRLTHSKVIAEIHNYFGK